MHSHAKLIILALRHMQALALADAGVDTIRLAARRAVVARADDDLIFYDNRAVLPPKTRRAPPDRFRNIEKILRPVWTRLRFTHFISSRAKIKL